MLAAAVIFDLDGTLLDTIDDLADAMNSALARHGLPTHPDYAEHKLFVGEGVRKYITRALPADRRGDEALIQRVWKDYRAAYAQNWHNKTRPYDGVPELLVALRARGPRLAVLSNKPDDFTRLTVELFFRPGTFEIVRGAFEDQKLKPDPGGALAIAAEMNLPPADFLYVGDTATDMQTAVAAGMFAVGALWGFRSADELLASGAKVLIACPAELVSLL